MTPLLDVYAIHLPILFIHGYAIGNQIIKRKC